MLTLYTIPQSLYSAKVRILLRHKQLEWRELLPPGGYGSDEYKTYVPSGNLPALVDGDFILADSEAIAEYLNEQYPDPAMLPSDLRDRAKVRERSRFHDTRLEPEFRKFFMSYIAPHSTDADALAAHSLAINTRLGQFAEMLEDSPHYHHMLTLGDCGFPVTFVWLEGFAALFDLALEWPAAVLEYKDRLDRYSAITEEIADYRPKITERLKTLLAERERIS